MTISSIIWDTSPELINLGPITIRWYGLLFALGFFLGYLILQVIYRRENKPEDDLGALLLYILLGAIIGARLGHCLFYEPGYYLARPGEIALVWRGGLASHGAAIGILIALGLYTRTRPQQPYLWLLDRMAISIALAGTLIRIGNFFNSEIIGTPSGLPWAIVFTRARLTPLQPRHPAMLYEAAAYLAIFVLLLLLYRKQDGQVPPGELIGLFLISVFTARFLIEYVKLPQASYRLPLPLSVGQLLSIPAVIAGIILYAGSRKRKRPPAGTA